MSSLLLLGVRNGDMLGAVWLPLLLAPVPVMLMLVAMVGGLTAELERVDPAVAERAPYMAAEVAVEAIIVFEVDPEREPATPPTAVSVFPAELGGVRTVLVPATEPVTVMKTVAVAQASPGEVVGMAKCGWTMYWD